VITYDSGTFDPSGKTGGNDFYDVAVGGEHVYWTKNVAEGGVSLFSCESLGCSAAPRIIDGVATGSWYAADATHVYWGSGHDTAILRLPSVGGARVEAIALNQSAPGKIALTPTHVYWMNASDMLTWSLVRVAKGGGEPPTTLFTMPAPGALTVDDAFVYWTSSVSNGAIFRCPLAGCDRGPAMLITQQSFPTELVTDGNIMVWINVLERVSAYRVRGEVVRCRIEACAATLKTWSVQDFSTDGMSLAMDETDVYWVAQGREPLAMGTGFFPDAAIYRHSK
jgi:hypothetical protein